MIKFPAYPLWMESKPRFRVIEGDKAAPLALPRDLLFGVKAFLCGLAVILAIQYWPELRSIVPVKAPSGEYLPAGRLADIHIIDGDTYEDRMSGVRYRLVNADTPEAGSRAKCVTERRHAEKAAAAARDLIAGAGRVEFLVTGSKDRYGRTLARVEVDGRDLGAALVARKLARPWRGHREPWCDHRGNLIL